MGDSDVDLWKMVRFVRGLSGIIKTMTFFLEVDKWIKHPVTVTNKKSIKLLLIVIMYKKMWRRKLCSMLTCQRPAQSVYTLSSAEAQRVLFGQRESTEWYKCRHRAAWNPLNFVPALILHSSFLYWMFLSSAEEAAAHIINFFAG